MKKWVFALVVGVCMLAFGSGVSREDTVKCGGETMYPGSVCEETRAGSTVDTKTYEEMKASHDAARRTFDSWGRWVLLGVGALLTIGGIVGIVRTRRRRAQPYLGPGHVPGQAEPRQPGQPNAPYTQGMAPLPPQQQYPLQQQYPPQNWGPPQR